MTVGLGRGEVVILLEIGLCYTNRTLVSDYSVFAFGWSLTRGSTVVSLSLGKSLSGT